MHALPDVLQLVLESSSECSTPRTLCSLLSVSSGCRAAVQRAAVHCHAGTQGCPGLRSLAGIQNFTAWLPGHYRLVSSLDLDSEWDFNFYKREYRQEALALITEALHGCATAAGAAGAGAPAIGPQRWPLHTVHCGWLSSSPPVLNALVPAGLQELNLNRITHDVCKPQMWLALGQLSSLTALTLMLTESGTLAKAKPTFYDGLAGAVGNLQQLAKLKLWTELDVVGEQVCQQLPASLQDLEMMVTQGQLDLQFGHMVSLGVIALTGTLRWPFRPDLVVAGQSVLPPHLKRLQLADVEVQVADLPSSLVHLSMMPGHEFPHPYVRMPLSCVLSVLSGLESLAMPSGFYTLDEQKELVGAIAARGTLLTSLELHMGLAKLLPEPYMFAAVAQLGQLRSLCLSACGSCDTNAFMRLTALPALTALSLHFCPGLYDEAAIGLISRLTALQRLELNYTRITGAVVPHIARLTRLEHLYLLSDDVLLQDADLQHFTGLTRLEELWVLRQPDCMDAASAQLRAQLPGLSNLHFMERPAEDEVLW